MKGGKKELQAKGKASRAILVHLRTREKASVGGTQSTENTRRAGNEVREEARNQIPGRPYVGGQRKSLIVFQ